MTNEGAFVREIVTDKRLDEELAALCPPLAFSREVEARIRTRAGLPARAAAAPQRRSRAGWVSVAAAVAAVAVGVVVVQPLLGDELVPAASAAAAHDLERAAVISEGEPDLVPGPGEYLFVWIRDSSLGSATTRTGKPLTAVIDTSRQVWIPADRRQEWLKRSESASPERWLVGSAALAREEGDGGLLDLKASAPSEVRAPCGDFPGWNGQAGLQRSAIGPGCPGDSGDWGHVTPQFLAELPTDPRGLYERMLADTARQDPRQVLELAASLLRSGQPSRELRTSLYRALTLIPGLDITDGTADLAGRRGVGLGVVQGALRSEIVIDPATGRYLGDRVVLNEAGTGMWQGVPSGTVVSSSAVTTGIVRELGAMPR